MRRLRDRWLRWRRQRAPRNDAPLDYELAHERSWRAAEHLQLARSRASVVVEERSRAEGVLIERPIKVANPVVNNEVGELLLPRARRDVHSAIPSILLPHAAPLAEHDWHARLARHARKVAPPNRRHVVWKVGFAHVRIVAMAIDVWAVHELARVAKCDRIIDRALDILSPPATIRSTRGPPSSALRDALDKDEPLGAAVEDSIAQPRRREVPSAARVSDAPGSRVGLVEDISAYHVGTRAAVAVCERLPR